MPQRWKHAPAGSHWGEFGPDDQLGRMNLVDRGKVLQGMDEVRDGITFCLSLPLDFPGGTGLHARRSPPQRYAIVRDGESAGEQGFCWPVAHEEPGFSDVMSDDMVLMSLQYSTQWDSFAHVGALFDADGDGVDEPVYYNGFAGGIDIVPAQEDPAALAPWARFPQPQVRALGIENLAEHGVQGRAVLVDLAHHLGRRRKAVGYDELMRVLDEDGIVIEPGDMVCLHTGFADALIQMNRKPDLQRLLETGCGLDGHDERLLNWIIDVRLACLIADNLAVETISPRLGVSASERRPRLPLHAHCLFKNGIHLGELWYLTPLAEWLRAHGRNRFLLTAPPLRLPGAVGSPVTPIATV